MSRINVGDHVRLVKDENLPGPRQRVGATDSVCRVDGNMVGDDWDDRSGGGMFEASRFEKVTLQ